MAAVRKAPVNTLVIQWRRGQVTHESYADLKSWAYSSFGLMLEYVNDERRKIPWSAIDEVIEGRRESVESVESVAPSGPGPSTGSDVPQGHEDQSQREQLKAPEQSPAEHVGGEDDGRDDEQDGAHGDQLPIDPGIETLLLALYPEQAAARRRVAAVWRDIVVIRAAREEYGRHNMRGADGPCLCGGCLSLRALDLVAGQMDYGRRED